MKQLSVPRVAATHDLSCFGRAALTVVIPILSTMGIQVCPLPTAVLSTHGRFPGHTFVDLTEQLQDVIHHWKSIGIQFDAIYSGYIGSVKQLEIMTHFIEDFSQEDQFTVIDPVLGDNGKLYGVTGQNIIEAMRRYIRLGHVITPNLTEAALLLDEPYNPDIQEHTLKEWLLRLAEKGPEKVVITSVPVFQVERQTAVIAYDSADGRFWKVSCDYLPAHFPGTGDAFTSVIVGSLLQGDSFPMALDRAVQFLSSVIHVTFGYSAPEQEGILLERVLQHLNTPLMSHSYEIFE